MSTTILICLLLLVIVIAAIAIAYMCSASKRRGGQYKPAFVGDMFFNKSVFDLTKPFMGSEILKCETAAVLGISLIDALLKYGDMYTFECDDERCDLAHRLSAQELDALCGINGTAPPKCDIFHNGCYRLTVFDEEFHIPLNKAKLKRFFKSFAKGHLNYHKGVDLVVQPALIRYFQGYPYTVKDPTEPPFETLFRDEIQQHLLARLRQNPSIMGTAQIYMKALQNTVLDYKLLQHDHLINVLNNASNPAYKTDFLNLITDNGLELDHADMLYKKLMQMHYRAYSYIVQHGMTPFILEQFGLAMLESLDDVIDLFSMKTDTTEPPAGRDQVLLYERGAYDKTSDDKLIAPYPYSYAASQVLGGSCTCGESCTCRTYRGECTCGPKTYGGDCICGSKTYGGECICGSKTYRGECTCGPKTYGGDCICGSKTYGGECICGSKTYGGDCICDPKTYGGDCTCGSKMYGGDCICGSKTYGGDCICGPKTYGGDPDSENPSIQLPGLSLSQKQFMDLIFQSTTMPLLGVSAEPYMTTTSMLSMLTENLLNQSPTAKSIAKSLTNRMTNCIFRWIGTGWIGKAIVFNIFQFNLLLNTLDSGNMLQHVGLRILPVLMARAGNSSQLQTVLPQILGDKAASIVQNVPLASIFSATWIVEKAIGFVRQKRQDVTSGDRYSTLKRYLAQSSPEELRTSGINLLKYHIINSATPENDELLDLLVRYHAHEDHDLYYHANFPEPTRYTHTFLKAYQLVEPGETFATGDKYRTFNSDAYTELNKLQIVRDLKKMEGALFERIYYILDLGEDVAITHSMLQKLYKAYVEVMQNSDVQAIYAKYKSQRRETPFVDKIKSISIEQFYKLLQGYIRPTVSTHAVGRIGSMDYDLLLAFYIFFTRKDKTTREFVREFIDMKINYDAFARSHYERKPITPDYLLKEVDGNVLKGKHFTMFREYSMKKRLLRAINNKNLLQRTVYFIFRRANDNLVPMSGHRTNRQPEVIDVQNGRIVFVPRDIDKIGKKLARPELDGPTDDAFRHVTRHADFVNCLPYELPDGVYQKINRASVQYKPSITSTRPQYGVTRDQLDKKIEEERDKIIAYLEAQLKEYSSKQNTSERYLYNSIQSIIQAGTYGFLHYTSAALIAVFLRYLDSFAQTRVIQASIETHLQQVKDNLSTAFTSKAFSELQEMLRNLDFNPHEYSWSEQLVATSIARVKENWPADGKLDAEAIKKMLAAGKSISTESAADASSAVSHLTSEQYLDVLTATFMTLFGKDYTQPIQSAVWTIITQLYPSAASEASATASAELSIEMLQSAATEAINTMLSGSQPQNAVNKLLGQILEQIRGALPPDTTSTTPTGYSSVLGNLAAHILQGSI
jgi:hypothetical protein